MKKFFALILAMSLCLGLMGCTMYTSYQSDALKELKRELLREYDCVDKMRYKQPLNGGSQLELQLSLSDDVTDEEIYALHARVGEVLSDHEFLTEFLEGVGFEYGPEAPEEPVRFVNPGPSIALHFDWDGGHVYTQYQSTRWDTSDGSWYVYEGYPEWPKLKSIERR